jgi:hypothetical protein
MSSILFNYTLKSAIYVSQSKFEKATSDANTRSMVSKKKEVKQCPTEQLSRDSK